MSDAREFDLGDILSITTGILVADRKMDAVYDILNYMTGDNLFTHQLGRAADECRPWLLRQHPQLEKVTAESLEDGRYVGSMPVYIETHGSRLPVAPIPKDDHAVKDPIEELVDMVGADKVMVVKIPPAGTDDPCNS